VFAADVDGLSASFSDSKIAWYENLNVSDPLDADTDDDGFSDGAEVAAGTDPNDPGSFPAAPVPTVSEWGLLVLGLLLAATGSLIWRRQDA
jgi:hypothetical protein